MLQFFSLFEAFSWPFWPFDLVATLNGSVEQPPLGFAIILTEMMETRIKYIVILVLDCSQCAFRKCSGLSGIEHSVCYADELHSGTECGCNGPGVKKPAEEEEEGECDFFPGMDPNSNDQAVVPV